MKKIIVSILLLSLMSLSGCNLFTGNGEDFPPVPDIEHYTFIENESNFKIEIQRYYNGEVKYPFVLFKGERNDFYNEIFEGQLPFFPEIADSVKIIYDNSIYVWHTKENAQAVDRSILLLSSYTGGKVNDKLYEIYYTFTDEDYDEAVELNEGG